MVATAAELTARARARAGSDDFGPDGWQEGLDAVLAAVVTDVGDDAEAVSRIEESIVGRLVTRLRVEAWYADHPAEMQHPVEGPLVLVGLPRTGTTALHYLLAVDPQFRHLRSWEVAEPVPPPVPETELGEVRRLTDHSREASAMHIRTLDGPVEDGPVHALHFHGEVGLPLPSAAQWARTADLASSFAYHEHLLRLLHSRRPPYRWLLKSPKYSAQVQDIAAHYPDVRFVTTHRDPALVIPSTCSVMVEATQRRIPGWLPADPVAFGHQVLEQYVDIVQRARAGRAALRPEQMMDVGQLELEHDALEVAERIYAFAGLELSDDVRAAMAQWATENRRGVRGEHRYEPEDYGLTAAEIRAAFAQYMDDFAPLM